MRYVVKQQGCGVSIIERLKQMHRVLMRNYAATIGYVATVGGCQYPASKIVIWQSTSDISPIRGTPNVIKYDEIPRNKCVIDYDLFT